jgi:hypothetical protein
MILIINSEFFEGAEVRTHASRTFFLKDHDHRRRVGARTRANNNCIDQFLKKKFNFIFLGKGMTIRIDIGRNASRDTGNGMIMNTTGRRESLGSGKNHLMFTNDGLEVLQHRGCLSGLNDIELRNNARMNFFEHSFHAMGTNDLWGTDNDALELIFLALLVELHN